MVSERSRPTEIEYFNWNVHLTKSSLIGSTVQSNWKEFFKFASETLLCKILVSILHLFYILNVIMMNKILQNDE